MSNLIDVPAAGRRGHPAVLDAARRVGQRRGGSAHRARAGRDDRLRRPFPGRERRLELPVVGGRLTIPGADFVGLREVRRGQRRSASSTATDARARRRSTCSAPTSRTSRPATRSASSRWAASAAPATSPARSRRAPSGGGRSRWPRLALLAVEWLLFHRPTRRSLARALGRRPAAARRSSAMTLADRLRRSGLAVAASCRRSASWSVGWLAASRTLPMGRRIASLVIRLVLVACLVLALAGHAAGAAIRSAQRRLPARRIGLDARRDPRGAGRLGATTRARDAGGRHRGHGRLRRQRAGRPPAVGARRARRPGIAAGGRRHRRRGRGAAGGGHLPERDPAADGAALGRQRHVAARRRRRSPPPRRAASGSTS